MSDIDCIIVGKDCAGSLSACVESVKASDYSRGKVHLYYLDEGSSDDSIDLAKKLGLAMANDRKAGASPLIQTLSAGRTLAADWFAKAVGQMKTRGVRGRIEQPDPHADWLKWVIYLEDNPPVGSIAEMDDGLVRREGEGELAMLDESMAFHDMHLKGWEHWWRWAKSLEVDRKEVWRRGWGTIALVALMIVGMAWAFWWIALVLAAAVLLLYPRIFEVEKYARVYRISPKEAAAFAWHRSLVVIPQCFKRRKGG